MNPQQISAQLGILARTKGCKFASFTYTNQQGETAKRFIQLGCDKEKLYRSDLEKLKAYKAENDIEEQARLEMVASIEKSLAYGIGNNPDYTQKGVWESIDSNLSVDTEKGKVRVLGLQLNKTILKAGIYPPKNSRPKTIAKKAIAKKLDLKREKIKSFSITSDQFQRIAANGETLEFS